MNERKKIKIPGRLIIFYIPLFIFLGVILSKHIDILVFAIGILLASSIMLTGEIIDRIVDFDKINDSNFFWYDILILLALFNPFLLIIGIGKLIYLFLKKLKKFDLWIEL